MQKIKLFFRLHKLKNHIQTILNISPHSFVKDQHFNQLLTSVSYITKEQNHDLRNLFNNFIENNQYQPFQILRIELIINQILTKNHQNAQRKNTQINNRRIVSKLLIQTLFFICQKLRIANEQYLTGLSVYVKNNFCIPYATYLIKAYKTEDEQENILSCFQRQLHKHSQSAMIRNSQNGLIQMQQALPSIEIQSTDFKVFNKIEEILKFSDHLHQMGRFYSSYQQIINLFLQLLRQLQLYYKMIENKINELSKLGQVQLEQSQREQLCLFVTQSERYVNRMNSFYCNKYLYYYVNNLINLKMELKISNQYFIVCKKQIKKHRRANSVDKNCAINSPNHNNFRQNSQKLFTNTKISKKTEQIGINDTIRKQLNRIQVNIDKINSRKPKSDSKINHTPQIQPNSNRFNSGQNADSKSQKRDLDKYLQQNAETDESNRNKKDDFIKIVNSIVDLTEVLHQIQNQEQCNQQQQCVNGINNKKENEQQQLNLRRTDQPRRCRQRGVNISNFDEIQKTITKERNLTKKYAPGSKSLKEPFPKFQALQQAVNLMCESKVGISQ